MELNRIQYYIEPFAVILSVAYDLKYSTKVIEKRISKSPFFIALENKYEMPVLFVSNRKLINDFYEDLNSPDYVYQLYNQTLWAAELYLRIQNKTNLTFEAIFLYYPLDEVYRIYEVYHEMDFNQAINDFIDKKKKETVLSLVMKKYKIKVEELANITKLSPSTISSLKRGVRDINKLEARSLIKIANRLLVRPETLLEIDKNN